MSEDRSGLFNFNELRRKTEEYNTISSKHSNSCGIDFDIDSNQQIIKSFKELRDKLKIVNKENIGLKGEVKSMQVQFRQAKEAESNLTSANHQLKDRVSQLQQSNEQWKKRIALMKQQLSERDNLKEEVKYLKQGLIDLKAKNESLEEERKKLIQISIEDKINLEEQISKLQAKKQIDDQYLLALQTDLSKAKQNIHKLENSLKRLEIKYDEEIFNKQWSKDNFEREHYEKKINQLQASLTQAKTRNRKEKQKRADLQKRLHQLQQITGLCSVKAQVYEGEVELMTKKVKKMERKISQAKLTAHKMADQKVNWQEKFTKTVIICEELINRVKREVMGDMVELAKTCQYKLNKLKDSKEESGKQTERLSSTKKYRTDKKSRNSVEKQNTLKNDYSYKKVYLESQNGKILFESDQNRPKEEAAKPSSVTNADDPDKQIETTTSFSNIQLKIRRQRDEMEKKLKQKMLYRKMQVCTSPSKAKLREDYLKLMDK